MRVGVIGCGNIANVHCWVLNKLGVCEPVAFADCVLEKAADMSKKYTEGKAAVYDNYIQMLKEEDLDVVHICTPHYLHVPMAIEALKHDVSVFMEKPPAISKDEFEELSEVVLKSKARIGFCFQNRYNATTKELDRIVKEKSLGNIIGGRGFVTWRRDKEYYSDDWHGNLKKEGGGALINQSIHTLDLLLRYLGVPKKVSASTHNYHLEGIIDVEDTIDAWLEFEGGKRANFYATTTYANDAPVILELTFENGRVMLNDELVQIYLNGAEPEFIKCSLPKEGVGKPYWGTGHLACIEDYYKCLCDNEPYGNDLDGVANTLYTTMRIYEEAKKNR